MTTGSGNLVILIVDDDREDIYLAERAFRAHRNDIQLLSAGSGSELFEYLDGESKGGGVATASPDLILLDINMPQLDGFDVLKGIRTHAEYAHVPVIMFTTSDNPEDVWRAYDAGANSYICKSVNSDEMKKITERICDFWLELVKLPKVV